MGRRFTIFALFYFVFEGKFQVHAHPGGGGGFWGGLYLEGAIHGGAYFRNFMVIQKKKTLCPLTPYQDPKRYL